MTCPGYHNSREENPGILTSSSVPEIAQQFLSLPQIKMHLVVSLQTEYEPCHGLGQKDKACCTGRVLSASILHDFFPI